MELEIVIVVCSSQESVSKPNFDKNFNSRFVLISRPQADELLSHTSFATT